MDAIQFLKQEHQKAKAAFTRVLEAAPTQRGRLWKDLQPELAAHEEVEETCLYGPLEDEAPSDRKLTEWVSGRHEKDVESVESMMKEAEKLEPQGERWLSKIRQIHAALESHIRREEGEIFPRIGQCWDASKLAKAGEEMHEMMAEKAERG